MKELLVRLCIGLGALLPPSAAALELSLDEAVARVLSDNRSLAAAALRRDGEHQSVLGARSEFDYKLVPTATFGRLADTGLGLAPPGTNGSLGLQLRRRFEWGTEVAIGPSLNRSPGGSNRTLNVSVRQPLLGDFGSAVNLGPVHRAEFVLAASDRALEQQRISAVLDAIAAFHDAVRHRGVAQVNAGLAERLRRHALIATSKEAAGLAGPLDGLRARIRLKDAEGAALQADAAHHAALGRLRVLLTLPPDVELRLLDPPKPEAPAGSLDDAVLRHRLDLAQLRAEVQEAARDADVAARAAWPKVSLHLNYGQSALQHTALAALVPATQSHWSVFLQLSGDLERIAEKRARDRARLHRDALARTLQEKDAEAVRQVRDQRRQITELRERMALRAAQIAQAQ